MSNRGRIESPLMALCARSSFPLPLELLGISTDSQVDMPRILSVSGFHPATRARDLAYEFERCVHRVLLLVACC